MNSEPHDKVIALRNYINAVDENAKFKNALTEELVLWIL